MPQTFSDWYNDNKEELSKRRRTKYMLDQKYREDMKSRQKERYNAKLKKDYPRTVMILDGKKFLTIGGLAQVIRRSEQTIREYHKDNIIPETARGNNRGWRIYSLERSRIVKKAFELFGEGKLESLKEVKKYIHERW